MDLLLHAAGVEISRTLPDKEPTEYDLVLDVKSDGWFNVLTGIGDLPIGATVVFSSVAGRFGNAGQTDYSAANDLLCKITSSFPPDSAGNAGTGARLDGMGRHRDGDSRLDPQDHGDGGGRVLPPEAGVAWIRRELGVHFFAGEVVVAGELGLMTGTNHETGGLEITAVDTVGTGPMVGDVVRADVLHGLVVQTRLDPTAQPFLDNHRIDGTAVLPGVMGIEAFAEVARLLTPDRARRRRRERRLPCAGEVLPRRASDPDGLRAAAPRRPRPRGGVPARRGPHVAGQRRTPAYGRTSPARCG